MGKSRRDFLKAAALTTTGLYSNKAYSSSQKIYVENNFTINEDLLSFEAHSNASFIGEKTITDIEGEIKNSFKGQYIRVAPGTKNVGDHKYNHFFDGDAFLYTLNFDEKGLTLKANFIDTKERAKEQSLKKAIYSEFGTRAPGLIKLKKNSSSINVIPWQNKLLCLSDTAKPIAVDAVNFSYIDEHTFSNTLNSRITFSAHPKFDNKTKKYYAYGITQSMSPELEIYELDPLSDTSRKIQKIELDYIPMAHDMLVTENYVLVLAPPMKISVFKMLVQQKSYAESLEVLEGLESTLFVFPKDINKEPFKIKTPHLFSFHHGNAYEEGNILRMTTFASTDSSIFNYLSSWNKIEPEKVTSLSRLRDWTIDLDKKTLINEEVLYEGCDFPRMNEKYSGVKNRYLYSVGQNSRPILNNETLYFSGSLGINNQDLFNDNFRGDLLAFKQIVKYDLDSYSFLKKELPIHQTVGEALFVEKQNTRFEDDGYLLYMGYDKNRKESFFDVLEANDLSLKSRYWLGCFLPMGFHANFLHT